MRNLELLAPARNLEIGIAAIDCGADAVYIAGPGFGARQAAGNSMEDVRKLCQYAHRFGARVFITINTIIYDNEIPAVMKLLEEAIDAGVDAIIDQDLALLKLTSIPLHASTQCAIRTPEKARFYEDLGYSRLVLEREMSLEQIRSIRASVNAELEFFVHGALCVCYSGQCYMSESISGRSANRGECIQACRALYDLVDDDGNVLVKNKALLSLKDYNLLHRLGDLAEAGVDSFKIEGRLKNISYVRNVTRAYSMALDSLVAAHPDLYRRASFGHVVGGFRPDLDKTFNRGYTQLFLDGKRCRWSSMDAPKSMGQEIGFIESVDARRGAMTIRLSLRNPLEKLHNGDGFSVISGDEIIGFRGDVCEGSTIHCKVVHGVKAGDRIFRNLDNAFEHELEANLPSRLINVSVDIDVKDDAMNVTAIPEDGRTVTIRQGGCSEVAANQERMRSIFIKQISKVSGIYSFALRSISGTALPILPMAAINAIRRSLAERLDAVPCKARPMPAGSKGDAAAPKSLTYKDNVANKIAKEVYESCGATAIQPAYELSHDGKAPMVSKAELMRTKYCIRYEIGLCPKYQHAAPPQHLYLLNNGRRYALGFDCVHCEMTVGEE